jgi:mannan endo-1,4-beta-mannosidase
MNAWERRLRIVRLPLLFVAMLLCGLAPACSGREAPAPAAMVCAPAVSSCGANCGACAAPTPADPEASAETRAVLTYLASLPSRSDKRVVSGQKLRYPAGDWGAVTQASGVTPGIMGVAYVCYARSGCGGKPFLKVPLATLIDHWNKGGLVQITEMIGNPKTNGGVIDTNFDSTDFDRLLTPGDPMNARYLAQLDVIAEGYQTLADAGVVVLVHALNEMNGNWLWWSGGTAVQYKALWRMEFLYLTQTKGLHNLLFTYAPNAGNGCYGAYYPGDAYIDVVGLDVYLNVDGPIPKADGYDELTSAIAPCKPFAFIEFGPLAGGNLVFSPRDYYQLIVAIKESMPKVVYWHSWNQVWGMGIADPATGQSHLNVPDLLADPWVVNRDDIKLPAPADSR